MTKTIWRNTFYANSSFRIFLIFGWLSSSSTSNWRNTHSTSRNTIDCRWFSSSVEKTKFNQRQKGSKFIIDQSKEGWEKIKEKIAGASSVIKFSHYKTCSEYKYLNLVGTFLCNASFLVKVLPDQWITVTNLQILKQINFFNFDKMRCSQLMDPEFNMKNKLLGKRMISNTEAVNAIQNNQFGSNTHTHTHTRLSTFV